MLKRCALALGLTLIPALGAVAQTIPTQVAFGIYRDVNPNEVCVYDNNRVCRVFISVPPSGPLQLQTLSFAPSEQYASLSATTSSSRVVLPTGETVVVYNTGTVPAYVAFGSSSIVATTGKNVIQPQSWIEFDVGLNSYTNMAAITASGSATLNLSGGTGLMTGSGGGSSGGGTTTDVHITSPLSQDTTPSASVAIVPTAGFRPSASGARMTPLTVTTSDSSVALPTGPVVVVTNVGVTNPMYCNVNGVAATVGDQLIVANGGQFPFTVPTGQTTLHCIATGSSTTANGLGGTGIPTPTGGGQAAAAGASNVTIIAPLGSQTEAASVAVTSGGTAGGGGSNLGTGLAGWLATLVFGNTAITTAINANSIPIPLPVDAGSFPPGGFTPNSNFATLAVTTASANVALPAGGGISVAITNIGTETAYVNFGTGGVTSTTSSNPVAAGQTTAFNVPVSATNVAAITVSGVTSLILAGGAGAYSGTGGGVSVISSDPCAGAAKTNVPISTASGTTALVTGVSAKKIYVCSLILGTPTAVSVSLSEGSSSTCGTSNQAAVIGVATSGTAANGMPLGSASGLTIGNGQGTIASTATAANYLCLFQSGTAQIAGNLTFVQK